MPWLKDGEGYFQRAVDGDVDLLRVYNASQQVDFAGVPGSTSKSQEGREPENQGAGKLRI
jgi:hypothetical protein